MSAFFNTQTTPLIGALDTNYPDGTTLDNCVIGSTNPKAATITNLTVTGSIIGNIGLAINDETNDYTLVLADAGTYLRMNKATANSLTVPPHASVAFPIGTQLLVRQVGVGATTIVAGSGVTINTPSTLFLRTQGSTVALVQTNNLNEWDLSGDLQSL